MFDPEGATPPSDSRRADFKTTIGYLGSIDERLDFDLLEHLIRTMPDKHFLFVGRIMVSGKHRKLEAYPNTTFLGARPPAQLANYVAGFDACIIPFRKNEIEKLKQ